MQQMLVILITVKSRCHSGGLRTRQTFGYDLIECHLQKIVKLAFLGRGKTTQNAYMLEH